MHSENVSCFVSLRVTLTGIRYRYINLIIIIMDILVLKLVVLWC